MTDTKLTLHEKILEAAAEAGYVQKSSRNQGQGYNFAGDEAITEKFREAFLKNGLIAYPDNVKFSRIDILPREGKDTPNVLVHVEGNYVVSDGTDSIYVQSLGSGMDVGDKATYKALTGFRKYAFRNAVMMATGDDPETSREDEIRPVASSRAGRGAVQASIDKAADQSGLPDEPKALGDPNQSATTAQKRMIRGKAREVGLTDDQLGELRKKVTGKFSTKDFNNADIDAMLDAMADKAVMAALVSGGEVVA